MKIKDPAIKENLINRLKRIEGQVRGIRGMLNEERDCQDIMQQLTAIHSAIQSTSRIFLQDYAATCLADLDSEIGSLSADSVALLQGKREKIVQDMIRLLDKAP
jgi:DNA-binding FrmR family transcriptional regulator